MTNQIVLATGNKGKLSEISAYIKEDGITFAAQSDFDHCGVDETGLTFVENALLKARAASEVSGLSALADDSGLVVPALDGAPGVLSARYAGLDASDSDRYRLLLQEMAEFHDAARAAYFHCALVWLRHPSDPSPIIAQGQWHGYILQEPAGDGGFGYDPVFYVPSDQCSAAQCDQERKNELSHRGQAMKLFRSALLGAFLG